MLALLDADPARAGFDAPEWWPDPLASSLGTTQESSWKRGPRPPEPSERLIEEGVPLEPAADVPDDPAERGVAAITVGPDLDCDFPTIGQAVASHNSTGVANNSIRVMTGSYDELVVLGGRAVRLIGGFADCNSATPVTNQRSTIDRGGSGLGLNVFYNPLDGGEFRQFDIENFEITNGGGTGFSSGGASVNGRPGRLQVNFRNVLFADNSRDGDGGGLRVFTSNDREGTAAFVTVDNESQFLRNTSTGLGGGVFCSSTHDQGVGTTLRIGSTLIFDNEASIGGGIALEGCRNTFIYSGGPVVLIFPTGGILNNTATGVGGGLYLNDGAQAEVRGSGFQDFGDPTEAALIAGNSASTGGGAYVAGLDTSLIVDDAYVINNTAEFSGGGFAVSLDATLTVRRNVNEGRCEPSVSAGGVLSRPRCSVIEGNSGRGGAFSAAASSSVDILRTIIRGNDDGAGSTGPIARAMTQSNVRFEGVLFDGNPGGFGIEVSTGSFVDVLFSTRVNETNTFARVTSNEGETSALNILSSIIEASEFGEIVTRVGQGTSVGRFDCVISNLPTVDWGGSSLTQVTGEVDPQFLDPDNGDFRLGDRSPALDYCDDFNMPDFAGLDGNPRGVIWTGPTPAPANGVNDGRYDLGAFEMVFEPRTADLAVSIANPDLFVDASQTSVEFILAVTNNGPETAYADIGVIDDTAGGALVNRAWTCNPPPGVTCTPASGTGAVSTDISDLPPGDMVLITVDADLVDTSTDAVFNYATAVFESGFNNDPTPSNNSDGIEVRIGVFADGFESPAPF